MANTSDGGKGDPPDPSNDKTNTDALFTTTPAAYRAKNDQISPDIDQVLANYNKSRPPVDCDRPDQSSRLNNNTTNLLPDSALGAPSNSHLAVPRAKNDQVSPDIDQVLANYDKSRPPVDFDRPDQSSSLNTTTMTLLPDRALGVPSKSHLAVPRAKNDQISPDIDQVLANYDKSRSPVDSDRPDQSSSLNNTTTTLLPDSTFGAPSNSHLAVPRANDQVSPDIDQVLANYDKSRPPVDCDRSDQPPSLNNNTTNLLSDSALGTDKSSTEVEEE